jgi:hypothetical protein
MRTRADFHKCHVGKSGARIQRPSISGSQVRALVRPPPSLLFWHFAETVEKGPLLAGFSTPLKLIPVSVRGSAAISTISLRPKFPVPGAIFFGLFEESFRG